LVDRRPLPALALTTDTSVLTAIGNDYGFEHIFERQIRGFGWPGDVFLAISTSGRSRNVLFALQAARDIGLVTIGFSGAESSECAGCADTFWLLRRAKPRSFSRST
jgi:D-sedoheptulose 7-phosphate isomerase